jgi:hypothetical protein
VAAAQLIDGDMRRWGGFAYHLDCDKRRKCVRSGGN